MQYKYYTLVTGASEGLGKALALECAKRKMCLVLVSLPNEGLHTLATFIQKNYDVDVLYYEYDLTHIQDCKQLFLDLKKKNIIIQYLINNAGLGNLDLFEQKDISFYEKMITLNNTTLISLTHLFKMQINTNQPAYVLNVGSIGGFFHMPSKTIYGATKAFVLSFSKALRLEWAPQNIHVSVLCPGGMNTNLRVLRTNRNTTGLAKYSIMNPEDVASVAIAKWLKGKAVIIPGKINRLLILINQILPLSIKNKIVLKQFHKLLNRVEQSKSAEIN